MMPWLLNPEVRATWHSGNEAELLAAYERVWERKTILRTLYESWYRKISAELVAGNIVEVGAGTGNLKRWLKPRACWTLDILRGKHVDIQADAMRLPFRAQSLDNIIMFDALHHFAQPFKFLTQVANALKPGGRLVLVEPFVSAWGWVVYNFFHHEHIDFHFSESETPKKAWEGNAAIPQLVLAPQNRARLPLRIVKIQYGDSIAYPLCGGFSYRALLPAPLLLALHKLEQKTLRQNRLFSLRIFAVLEKPA
jgi:SAM-dependent methyltransferase